VTWVSQLLLVDVRCGNPRRRCRTTGVSCSSLRLLVDGAPNFPELVVKAVVVLAAPSTGEEEAEEDGEEEEDDIDEKEKENAYFLALTFPLLLAEEPPLPTSLVEGGSSGRGREAPAAEAAAVGPLLLLGQHAVMLLLL